MNKDEILHIFAAAIVFWIVVSFRFILYKDWGMVSACLFFIFLIFLVAIVSKKIAAYYLDADVEHRIWMVGRYWFRPGDRFRKELPFGVIIPLLFTLFSFGALKVLTLLTFETSTLRARAARRFGYFSYVEMTDLHNAIIAITGVVSTLILSLILYFLPFNLEYFSAMAIYYAFFNTLPISKLDGSQILFGTKVWWSIIFTITVIFLLATLFIY